MCRHTQTIVEDGGPRNPWRGYTFCADCGVTVGAKWRRKIDDFCERSWGYRPHKTVANPITDAVARGI